MMTTMPFILDVKNGMTLSLMISFYKSMHALLSVADDIILLDSTRIVLPHGSIKSVLQCLHECHPGQKKILGLASGLFHWQGQTNDIKTFVTA